MGEHRKRVLIIARFREGLGGRRDMRKASHSFVWQMTIEDEQCARCFCGYGR